MIFLNTTSYLLEYSFENQIHIHFKDHIKCTEDIFNNYKQELKIDFIVNMRLCYLSEYFYYYK